MHSRLGLLNFPLYALAQSGEAYGGRDAPLRAIKHGDNWFYHGSDGYNPAAGLGSAPLFGDASNPNTSTYC